MKIFSTFNSEFICKPRSSVRYDLILLCYWPHLWKFTCQCIFFLLFLCKTKPYHVEVECRWGIKVELWDYCPGADVYYLSKHFYKAVDLIIIYLNFIFIHFGEFPTLIIKILILLKMTNQCLFPPFLPPLFPPFFPPLLLFLTLLCFDWRYGNAWFFFLGSNYFPFIRLRSFFDKVSIPSLYLPILPYLRF